MIRYGSGEGIHRTARGSDMWFKTVAATTSGRFSLMERRVPPGATSPPPHRHQDHDEAYVIFHGVVDFWVDDVTFQASSGDFVLVEAGEAHTFGNTGEDEARLLIIHAPALDDYFKELEELWRDATPDRADELALMRRHGMEPA